MSQSVASPCINVCRMDAAGAVCEGCWRTLDEIAAWGSLDDAAKLQVWRQIRARKQARRDAPPPPREADHQDAG